MTSFNKKQMSFYDVNKQESQCVKEERTSFFNIARVHKNYMYTTSFQTHAYR